MSLVAIFLWVSAIGAGLALSFGGVLLLVTWASAEDRRVVGFLGLVLAGLVSCFWVAAAIWGISRSDNSSGIVEWNGGMGSETVCWFAEKDNPDSYVRAGDVNVPIDGGTSTVTRCAKSSKDVPR